MREAYLSSDEADAYHNARPSKAKWQAAGGDRQALLVAASDYLDAMFGLPPDMVAQMRGGGAVPDAVRRAVAELALIGDLVQGGAKAKQKTLTKGAMSASFGAESEHSERLMYVRQLLRPFVKTSVCNVKLERG